MTFWKWSQTPASNATADSTINWAEGQAPSSVNDSARAMMTAAAKYRDDISGAIVTGGTSTAYTVTSYEVFDTLAHMANQMIAFTPHATNGATVTLNVDGLGAKPLRSAPSTELLAGVLIQGTPYVAVYNNSDASFYLQGFYGNPYSIPLGAGIEFWGATAPNSSFVFAAGQAISRSTYSGLFAIFSTTYGAGDGSTTFNIPDKRGRVSAAADNMGGSAAGRITTATMATAGLLAQTGGFETHTLVASQIPAIGSSNGSGIALSVTSNVSNIGLGSIASCQNGASGTTINPFTNGAGTGSVTSSGTLTAGAVSVTSTNTGGAAHPNLQPTICSNYILRII